MCGIRNGGGMIWDVKRVSEMDPQALDWVYRHLSPTVKSHIDSLNREADRNRSLTGQWLLRQLLKAHWDMAAPVISRNEKGAPVLENAPLHLSVAHSGELVACAVSHKPVGIDLEQLRPFRWGLIQKVCTEPERQYVLSDSSPAGEQCEDETTISRFFEIWTGKEAWFKMQGTGITDLKSVNVLQLNRQLHSMEDYMIQIAQPNDCTF